MGSVTGGRGKSYVYLILYSQGRIARENSGVLTRLDKTGVSRKDESEHPILASYDS